MPLPKKPKANPKNQNRIRARGPPAAVAPAAVSPAGSIPILIFWICFKFLGKRHMNGEGAGNIMLDGLSRHFSLYLLGKHMENVGWIA